MDLGLTGRSALVCSVTTDLGRACAASLAAEGARVVATAESEHDIGLPVPAPDASKNIEIVVCDITTRAGRDTALQACAAPDILVNHAPGPAAGDFRDWTESDWERALQANMLSAIEMIQRTFDGMLSRGFGRIVNITSQSVRSPIERLDLSNAARAGLTGFVAGVARERRDADVTINNLLPGLFDTAPLGEHAKATAANEGVSASEVLSRFAADIPLGRLGRPEEFGNICAFLCSRPAGFINAQNILVDGGAFRSVI